MAQIKRKKVSNVATKGQKKSFKELRQNKWFWVICSCCLIVVVAAIVIPIVLVNVLSKDTTKTDYFAVTQTYTDSSGSAHDVNFEKMSYSGLLQHTNTVNRNVGVYDEHVYVFALDVSAFHPVDYVDESGDEKKADETHKVFLDYLIQLQYRIDLYNKNNEDNKCKLYIVDTTTNTYSENASILDDSERFETTGSAYPLFCYYSDDKLTKEFKGTINDEYREDNSIYYYSDYSRSSFSTVIRNAIKYLENNFVDEEKN